MYCSHLQLEFNKLTNCTVDTLKHIRALNILQITYLNRKENVLMHIFPGCTIIQNQRLSACHTDDTTV